MKIKRFKYNLLDTHKYGVHSIVSKLIVDNSEVLDIGCATGYFDKRLIRQNCIVWGIDNNIEALNKAKEYCQRVFKYDANNLDKLNLPKKFDYVLLMDVIEHLQFPENCLKGALKFVKPNGQLIISTPNIAHLSVRLKVLFGKFDYEKLGILDNSHMRFYTKKSFLELLNNNGYKVDRLEYTADFGQIPALGRLLDKIPQDIQSYFTFLLNTLLAVQLIAICQKVKMK